MATVPVNVYVKDNEAPAAPIAGAVVSLLVPGTFVIAATAETNDNGVASFLVPGMTYELRVYRQRYSFQNPWRVEVLEDGSTNAFEVYGTRIGQFGVATDPRLCRCVGRFVGHQNEPIVNALIRIVAEMDLLKKNPKVVDGNMVMPTELQVRTDYNGFVVADLMRGGEYWFMFAGEEDQLWNFKVPNLSVANLVDLIHPGPVSVEWDPAGPLNLRVGDSALISPVVLFTDLQDHMDKFLDVFDLMNSDTLIAQVAYQSETKKLAVVAVAPGAASVTATVRAGLYPTRVPDYSLISEPLLINVAP